MTHAEFGPINLSPEESEPRFDIISGDGADVWSRKPEDFGVDKPITASLFASSNLMRNLRERETIVRSAKYSNIEETVIPRTTRAEIVKEIFRRCLPKELRELADMLGDEAGAAEFDYEQLGYANDPEIQAELRSMVPEYSDSLLMKGFEALIEASDDYDNGLHVAFLRDAQVFGVYLIDQSSE